MIPDEPPSSPTPAADSSEAPRPFIPDYELLKFVDRGSYGDVWLARSITGLYRAVKIVWRDRFAEPQPYEREFKGLKEFAAVSLVEARQMALLHVGRGPDFFYYVMELADDANTGRDINPELYRPNTLREVRARRGRLPALEVVTLGVELGRALAGLHARGLVHRDIKPSNVILVGGVPKLADIGLVTSATEARTFVGTEGYVSPEGPGAPAADVFSLGRLLYELATGLDRREYPRLPPELGTWPDRKDFLELNAVIVRACEPNAMRRHRDAAALLEDLLLLQAGKSVRRLRAAEQHLGRALRAATLLAVAATVAGAGAWIEHAHAAKAEAERDELARKSLYSAGLARAQQALEANDLGLARNLLHRLAPRDGAPDLRGFEWWALTDEAAGDPARVLRESGAAVQRVCVSPDGRLIAAHTADAAVSIWNAHTGVEVKRVAGIQVFAGFSADGGGLLGTDRAGKLHRWSLDSRSAVASSSNDPATNIPLGLIGSDLVVSFVAGTNGHPDVVRVWDALRGSELSRCELAVDPVAQWELYNYRATAVSRDGRWCALVFLNGRAQHARWKLEIYDLLTRKRVFADTTEHRITALAFSPDGGRLAKALGDTAEIAMLWRANDAWNIGWQNSLVAAQTNSIRFSPDGAALAVGGRDPVVRIVAADTGELLSSLHGHGTGDEDVAWTPDGASIVSGSAGGDIRHWQGAEDHAVRELTGLWKPAGGGRRVVLSDDATLLATSDSPEHGTLVASVDHLTPIARIPGPWMPVGFTPQDELGGVQDDGSWQLWQLHPLARLDQAAVFDHAVAMGSSVSTSSDGQVVGIATPEGEATFWAPKGHQRLASVAAHARSLWSLALSPDGRYALTAGGVGRARAAKLWRVGNEQPLASVRRDDAQPLCAAFSPHGVEFALGWNDGTIEIHSVPGGTLVRTMRTDSALIQSIVYSPDGKRIAGGAPLGTLHLFATEDGREVLALRVLAPPGSDSTISSVAFARNGRAAAAYLNDGRVRVWRW